MRMGQVALLITNAVLIAVSVFNAFFDVLDEWALAVFLAIAFFCLFKYFGFQKANRYNTKDLLTNISIGCLIHLIVTYLSGLFLGFLKSSYSMSFSKIVTRTLPIIFLIILTELVRFIVVSKIRKNRLLLVFTTLSFVCLDLTLHIKTYDFGQREKILDFILALTVSLSKNSFLTYATFKTDYKISTLYRLYAELPAFFMPIFPDLTDYVNTLINFLMPIIFIFVIYKNFAKTKLKKEAYNPKSKAISRISFGALGLFILFFVGLTCGWFKYFSLAIGSGSMAPNIDKGDVIIIEKLNEEEKGKLVVGEVLVFKYENRTIVHRIVNIEKEDFYTKGDANNAADVWPTRKADIIGKTNFRVPLMGWPVVALNELLHK